MMLILSCITKGEDQLRDVLARLVQVDIAKHAIVVLHPGDGSQPAVPALGQEVPEDADHADTSRTFGATVGAAASGGTVGGT